MEEHIWQEHLIWCPSQISYYFTDPTTNIQYEVYLRWRYRDPWTSELFRIDSDGEWLNVDDPDTVLRVGQFKANEYKELEKAVVEELKRRFPHIEFKTP